MEATDTSTFTAEETLNVVSPSDQDDLLDHLWKQFKSKDMPSIPPFFKSFYHQFIRILLFKPPVGIAAMFTVTRLVLTGRIFRLYAVKKNSVEELVQREARKRRSQRHRGRAFQIDPDDKDYDEYGGIDRIRRKLCSEAIAQNATQGDALVAAIQQALQVNNRPGGSRAQYIQESILPMAQLERYLQTSQASSTLVSSAEFQRIIEVASLSAQVRTLDALLRVCRDRLLKTSHRLARTHDHWSRRVRSQKLMPQYWQRWRRQTIEEDRVRLTYAEAAYKTEVTRVGKIARVLMERPSDLEESYLLQTIKTKDPAEETHPLEWLPKPWQYSIRWNAEGKFKLSIRKLESEGDIDAENATRVLLDTDMPWRANARDWTMKARQVLCQVVWEALLNSATHTAFPDTEFARVKNEWCLQKYSNTTDIESQWMLLLRYVDNLPSWRRVGEGKVVRLRDALMVDWTRRLDIMGIPSTLAIILGANYVHEWLSKIWPTFKKDASKAFWKTLEVLQTRVWGPIKGIWDEIMNKSKGIMSGFTLEMEQSSLDHMLRDLGYGDGSATTRLEALQMATDEYERGLRTGVFKNVLGGRLVRLLLIQVQQLKVGMLSALDTIDVLMQGNRIHFQFLAAIPAVLITTIGTRIFLRSLYNIRTRDLRPVTAVHSEMSEYLVKVERLLLLSDQVSVDDHGQVSRSPGKEFKGWRTSLSDFELGELLLNLHRYLILMDYTSPPFPNWHCDQIHKSLQELLGTGGTLTRMNSERHVSWLHLIQRKHQDLLKHL